jgi:hypothetical protein
LPFGDLEPHRFEDLVRQLAYDLRRWKLLEATGHGGSDRGMDIRAVELVPLSDEVPGEDQEADETFLERQWIFQCKREKSLPPKKIRKLVKESLAFSASPPYGFVLAAACDISREARDVFREEMVSRGIEEFFIWAKSELEDLLFQPKNDRLLFAYFGLALQPKRRAFVATLRSEITKKKQLTALIGEEEHRDGKLVLLRDPSDERYPYEPKSGQPPARWLLCRALTLRKPGNLVVLEHEYLAAVSTDGKHWDAILDYDTMLHMAEGELQSAHAWNREDSSYSDRSPYDFWNEYFDESQRALLKVRRAVPLDRVLALDPLGDGFFPVPHILIEFVDKTGPFTASRYPSLEPSRRMGGRIDIDLDESNRTRIFPNPLPKGDAPEPAGFDDTGKALPLTSAIDARLETLLAKLGARTNVGDTDEKTSIRRTVEKSRTHFDEFRDWREQVALPVFSAFVLRLRRGGHRARVVVRSVPVELGVREASESVELRVQLRKLNHYVSSGNICISLHQHATSWRTAMSPLARNSQGAYVRSNDTTTIEKTTTKEQLEVLVLTMLERMDRE